MIQPLFGLVMVEMVLVMSMSFGSPIRKMVVKGLDLLKQGRGPLVSKTVAATMLVVFGSTLFTLTNIQKRVHETGVHSQTDEVLIAQRLLEASLMGFSLFLGLMIDRLHYYVREITTLKKSLELEKILNHSHEQPKSKRSEETKKPKVN
ncbi:hypothetical protein QN277_016263 [Acacia crassicarpa]|uniref:Endoplasmic reticulum transmembrane protein n=1 Tax=Acacia crassicarpa TaxID=499986 RepID=A0AAE1MW91_9FABA|nr:hypothetical protein QN277_016263 [Acacia crassicarpa]